MSKLDETTTSILRRHIQRELSELDDTNRDSEDPDRFMNVKHPPETQHPALAQAKSKIPFDPYDEGVSEQIDLSDPVMSVKKFVAKLSPDTKQRLKKFIEQKLQLQSEAGSMKRNPPGHGIEPRPAVNNEPNTEWGFDDDADYEQTKRDQKAKRAGKPFDGSQRIKTESSASDEAKKLGLQLVSFGMYADKSGNVTHRSVDGKLVPVKSGAGSQPSSTSPTTRPPPDGYTLTLKVKTPDGNVVPYEAGQFSSKDDALMNGSAELGQTIRGAGEVTGYLVKHPNGKVIKQEAGNPHKNGERGTRWVTDPAGMNAGRGKQTHKMWAAGNPQISEDSPAAKQAKQQGLESLGWGRWGKNGKMTHTTVNGKLIPYSKKGMERASGMTFGRGKKANQMYTKRKVPGAQMDEPGVLKRSMKRQDPSWQRSLSKPRDVLDTPASRSAAQKVVDKIESKLWRKGDELESLYNKEIPASKFAKIFGIPEKAQRVYDRYADQYEHYFIYTPGKNGGEGKVWVNDPQDL